MSGERKTRVLILGGGFGGVATAQALAKQFKRDRSVEVTLVNRDNYFVFVPMLASAAAGSIETLHAVAPLRRLIRGVHFRAEEVVGIDLARRIVTTTSPTTGRERQLPFDHLVLALGNVINLSRMPGAAQHGKTLKTLGDALAIRNHVLAMLEAADIETDPATRHEMLTFVVAGGGFSGVEMVGELNDLVHEALRHYPSITREQVRVLLLHSGDRILPEMSASTADYAIKKLRKRGVDVRLNVRLGSATPHEAVLQGGEKIPTRTLIVAIGNAPPPVLEALAVPKDRGRIVVDEYMRVPEQPGLWALGDNAIVPNRAAANGEPSPPTAQYALRQGKQLGANIAAAIRGGQGAQLKPFAFGGLGLLCLLGHGVGVGELPGNIKLKGLLGFFMWRFVYWTKMPSFGRRVQLGVGWALDFFLQRDIVQVGLARTQTIGRAHYEPGEFIFRQGEPGDHFYMITEGEVEVVRERADGRQTVLARLGKGEYFGETALLDRRRRNASVRCATPVDVITLGRDDFATLANTWLELSQSLREVSEQRVAAAPLTTFVTGLANVAAARSFNGVEASMMHPTAPGAAGAAPTGPAYLVRRDSGAEVALDRDLVGLGRGPDNHVVVPDPRASRRHALIQREGASYTIEDLDTANGTWVNGRRIAERTPLRGDDVIQIGATEFTFREPQAAAAMPEVIPMRGARLLRASTGEEIALDRDLVSIGRGAQNQIVVPDPSASRRHALLQREGEAYWIEDLGAPNGTFVNEQRVTGRAPLNHGDEIRIGGAEFTFQLAGLSGMAREVPRDRASAPAMPAMPSTPVPQPRERTPAPPPPPVGLPGAHAGPAGPMPRQPAPPPPPPAVPPPPPGEEAGITTMIEGLDRLPGPGGQPGQQAGEITRLIHGLDVPTPGAEPVPVGEVTRFIQGLDAAPRGPAGGAAPAPASGPLALSLRLLGGPAGGDQTLQVGPAGATLGRAPDNTIPIPDRRLSRYHARIEFAHGAYWLTDLGTTNGTFVNRARLTAPHQLRPDDVISLGDTNLVVVP